VSELDCTNYLAFRHAGPAGLHHYDALCGARDNDAEGGFPRLFVTRVRDELTVDHAYPDGAEDMVRRIRAVSDLPVALGFGISKPEHVREVGRWADAAVVGSALVNVIAEAGASADLDTRVEEYVRWLKG
jgi:hypothetical protein